MTIVKKEKSQSEMSRDPHTCSLFSGVAKSEVCLNKLSIKITSIVTNKRVFLFKFYYRQLE